LSVAVEAGEQAGMRSRRAHRAPSSGAPSPRVLSLRQVDRLILADSWPLAIRKNDAVADLPVGAGGR